MGLDMYLTGEKYFFAYPPEEARIPHEDGFEVRSQILRLGYWRKHPNLHGYIVNNFADGEDNCQSIFLDETTSRKSSRPSPPKTFRTPKAFSSAPATARKKTRT